MTQRRSVRLTARGELVLACVGMVLVLATLLGAAILMAHVLGVANTPDY